MIGKQDNPLTVWLTAKPSRAVYSHTDGRLSLRDFNRSTFEHSFKFKGTLEEVEQFLLSELLTLDAGKFKVGVKAGASKVKTKKL